MTPNTIPKDYSHYPIFPKGCQDYLLFNSLLIKDGHVFTKGTLAIVASLWYFIEINLFY